MKPYTFLPASGLRSYGFSPPSRFGSCITQSFFCFQVHLPPLQCLSQLFPFFLTTCAFLTASIGFVSNGFSSPSRFCSCIAAASPNTCYVSNCIGPLSGISPNHFGFFPHNSTFLTIQSFSILLLSSCLLTDAKLAPFLTCRLSALAPLAALPTLPTDPSLPPPLLPSP